MPSSISIQLNQEQAMSKNQYFLLLVLAFVIGSSLGVYWPVTAQEPQIKPNSTAPETVDAPKVLPPNPRRLFARNVVFSYQPDSPLEVVSVVDAEERGQEQIRITLKNVNAQAIRTFTLETKSYSDRSIPPLRGSLSNLTLNNTGVLPNETVVMYLTMNHFDHPEMQINVDFVEFIDGTIWGEDKSKFHEYVVGFREGFLALMEKLIEQVETKNAAAEILQEIARNSQPNSRPFENNKLGITVTKDSPPQWQSGFWNGVERAKFALKGLSNREELTNKLYESRNLMQSLGAGQNDTK
jgi:hypothetical protein